MAYLKQLRIRFLCWWNDVCYVHKEIKTYPQWVGTTPYCNSCLREHSAWREAKTKLEVKRRQEEQEKILGMIP